MSRILALDLGTSSVRAAIFDAQGRRIADSLYQRQYPLHTAADGQAELDPETVLRALTACLRGALLAGPVSAVGMSCFWHSIIGLDASGRAITPIITWADSRCAGDAAQLRKRLSEPATHARTGCMQRASFWPAKLAWIRRTQPALWRRAARWLSPSDWLHARLLDLNPLTIPTSHSLASATGLYHTQRKIWDAPLVRALGLHAKHLPAISDAALPADSCRIRSLRAARWLPAIGDGAANNLGTGALRSGIAAINFGTSAAIRIIAPAARNPHTPVGLFRYRIDAARQLIGGAISNAGGLRQWCLDHLRLPDEATLERTLAKRPGPHPALRVLPFWLAERAPTWRDDVDGVIAGIRQATTAVDLYQAITEATFQRLATILDCLPRRTLHHAVVGGGLQRSAQALQRLADVLGLPLLACDEAETSLRGAALFALGRDVPATGTLIRPRRGPAAAYARQRRQLATLERTLFGTGAPSPSST